MRGLFQGPCLSSKQIKTGARAGPAAPHLLSIPGVSDGFSERTRPWFVSFINQTGIEGPRQEEALVRRLRTLLVNLTGSIKGCRLWRGWFPKQISPRAPLPACSWCQIQTQHHSCVLKHVTILQQAVMMVMKSFLLYYAQPRISLWVVYFIKEAV